MGWELKAVEQGLTAQGEQQERDEFGKFKGQKRPLGPDHNGGRGGWCGMVWRVGEFLPRSESVSSTVKWDGRVTEILQGDAVCRGPGLLKFISDSQ